MKNKPLYNIIIVGFLCFVFGFMIATFFAKFKPFHSAVYSEGFDTSFIIGDDSDDNGKPDSDTEKSYAKSLASELDKLAKKMNDKLFDNKENYEMLIRTKQSADESTKQSMKDSLFDIVHKFTKMYEDGFGESILEKLTQKDKDGSDKEAFGRKKK
jgi:hypothetical protein